LEYIAVGRELEINALLRDLDNQVSEGGASFRIISGRYGSGKSFLCQLIRNYALQKNFVVMDADFSPERRLTGTQGQGLNLYRELLKNMSTRTRPDGGAFSAVLERWISDLQKQVIDQLGIQPVDPRYRAAVDKQIRDAIHRIEELVHGFDFAAVLSAYWHGYHDGDDALKDAALRWLRGELTSKTDARAALGVRVIIDDDSWYDYVKLIARFVKDIGYKGLVIFLDEAVNLYKISNSVSRTNNYEKLLTMFNDAMQGKVEFLGVVLGATPQMVEDNRRGLFSYEALRSRLQESRFARDGLRDLANPLIRLETLEPEELFLLLRKLRDTHALHFGYEATLTDRQIEFFLKEVRKRIGADQLLTPREVTRDFITVLNLLQQNPDRTLESIVGGSGFIPTRAGTDPEALTPETEIADDEAPPQSPASPYKSFDL